MPLLSRHRWISTLAIALGATLSAQRLPAQSAVSESVRFASTDGVELHGVFYPAKLHSPCVLMLHPIGENLHSGGWRRFAEHLQSKGFAVLRFDFRGHGQSTTVDSEEFWSVKYPPNRTFVKGASSEEISVRDFDRRYYPILVNDIAAAKSFLDRRNDTAACNASNLILIGSHSGATLGAIWLRAEFHRFRFHPAPVFGGTARVEPAPQGQSVLSALLLDPQPKLGGSNINLATLLDLPVRQKKVPAVFLFDPDDSKAKSLAGTLAAKLRGKEKTPFSGATAVAGLGAGSDFPTFPTPSYDAITDYLKSVEDAYAREWTEMEPRQALYVWRHPRNGAILPANDLGMTTLNYSTYALFLPSR